MFTGIVQEVGTVCDVQKLGGGVRLTVEASKTAIQLSVDDSVSINGVCQTVVWKDGDRFSVVAVEETLLKTGLGSLTAASPVNLELAMQLNDRLGGHLVTGHVDCVGSVVSIGELGSSWVIKIVVPSRFERYVIAAGSIAVDGVSLTVAAINGSVVVISIIPHTKESTIFSTYAPGTSVNLEFDIIGKYVERLLGEKELSGKDDITPAQLKVWGYDL